MVGLWGERIQSLGQRTLENPWRPRAGVHTQDHRAARVFEKLHPESSKSADRPRRTIALAAHGRASSGIVSRTCFAASSGSRPRAAPSVAEGVLLSPSPSTASVRSPDRCRDAALSVYAIGGFRQRDEETARPRVISQKGMAKVLAARQKRDWQRKGDRGRKRERARQGCQRKVRGSASPVQAEGRPGKEVRLPTACRRISPVAGES